MVQEVTLEIIYNAEHDAPSRWDWRALTESDVAVVEAGDPRRLGEAKVRPPLSERGRQEGEA